jgi:transcriptional antiterminator NusG
MFMPQRNDFSVKWPVVGGVANDVQCEKIDRALREKAIRIRNIDMASRRIANEYPDIAGWYCLSVEQRREFTVENMFVEMDIEACVPRFKGQEKVHRGRKIRAPMLPVIPGYMLVRCVPSPQAFVGLRGAKHVTGIIGRGEIPYRVPTKKIDHFITLAAEGKYDYRREPHGFVVGLVVRVAAGDVVSFVTGNLGENKPDAGAYEQERLAAAGLTEPGKQQPGSAKAEQVRAGWANAFKRNGG